MDGGCERASLNFFPAAIACTAATAAGDHAPWVHAALS